MSQDKTLDERLHEIRDAYLRSPPEKQERIVDVIEVLAAIIGAEARMQKVSNRQLFQIVNYAKRRIEEDDSGVQESDDKTLQLLRNKFAHGTLVFATDEQERRYQKLVWRVITRSAGAWNSHELSNFLAYCIGVRVDPSVNIEEVSQEKIVNLYKAAFNTLDRTKKVRAVRELLMRISLDPSLRQILEKARSGQ